jgi:hypothetical protein
MDARTRDAIALMADNHARDYYRRSGFNGIIVRDRPGVKRQRDIFQVHQEQLNRGDLLELIVYPELTLRRQPWSFWGVVLALGDEQVVLKQVSGGETDTIIRVPYRYFQDGRVYRRGQYYGDKANSAS